MHYRQCWNILREEHAELIGLTFVQNADAADVFTRNRTEYEN